MANLLDTFTRAAGETTPFALQNHTSNSGATWKNQSIPGAGLVLTTANTAGDGGPQGTIWYSVTGGTGAPASTDYSVGANLITTGTPNANFGLALHMDAVNSISSSTGSGYIAAYVGSVGWSIYRINAGAYTQLGFSATPALAAGSTAIIGTVKTNTNDVTLTISISGTVVVTAVDTAANRITSGAPGLYGYNLNTSGTVAFGNFTAQDTAAAAAATIPAAPTGVTATGATGQNNVTWTGSAGATSYNILRATAAAGPFAAAGTSTGTTFADTGATVGTAYYYAVTATNAAGTSAQSVASPTPATATAAPAGGNIVYADAATLRYSPGNWQVSGSAATAKAASTNPGAYLKQYFANATSLSIGFDVTLNAGQTATQIPMVAVRIDGAGWQYFPVAATITPTLPPSRAMYRLLEIAFASVYPNLERWAVGNGALAPVGSIVFTGLTYNSGATSALVPSRKYKILVLGDSIVEGVNANTASGSYTNTDNNAVLTWAFNLQTACNAEVGCIGYSGQAVTNTTYSASLPVATTTYNSLWTGAARSFAGIDAVLLEWGTNDGAATDAVFATGVQQVGNGIKAANAATKLLLLKNNNDTRSAGLVSAGTALGAPVEGGLVAVMTLATDSLDNTHPSAATAQTKYLPAVAQAVNALVLGTGAAAPAIPTGSLPVGLSIFKFVSATADNIANYPGLGIIWTVPDAGSWTSGRPAGPSFQAVTQFLPGRKYYVYNTSAAAISLYGAQL